VTTQTKELVFHRPDPRLYLPPIQVSDIERVMCIKLLGDYFSENPIRCSPATT